MFRGTLRTDEEVNNAKETGMYRIESGAVSVVPTYSLMIVFNDGISYCIQMVYALGGDRAGFRRFYNTFGVFKYFTLS